VSDSDTRFRQGLLVGLIAYVWWGLVPIYFRQVREVPALEILAHRIVWSVLLLGIVLALGGPSQWNNLGQACRSRKTLFTLACSAFLLTLNWLLYIYAAVQDRITEAGLGYYMLPLVNAFLATVFLGEKLRPLHYPALGLVALGVALPMALLGSGWLSIALPVSFGIYGLLRKQVAVESFLGLVLETLCLLPFCVGYLIYQQQTTGLAFGQTGTLSALLAFGGVVTVVPLLAFGFAIRRLPLLTITFIQFVSPSMQFLVALFWNGETPPWPMWAAIGCVWLAVGLFMIDAVRQLRSRQGTPETVRKLTVNPQRQIRVEASTIPRGEPG